MNALLLIPIFWALFLSPAAFAEMLTTPIVKKTVLQKLKEVKADLVLDEHSKKELLGLYGRTLDLLGKERSLKRAGETFRKARRNAPKKTLEIQERLKRLEFRKKAPVFNIAMGTPLSEIELILEKEKAELSDAEAALKHLENLIAMENGRPNAIKLRLEQLKKNNVKIESKISTLEINPKESPLNQALRWRLVANNAAIATEIDMLDEELLSQSARIELLKAQKEEALEAVEVANTRVDAVRLITNRLRNESAEQLAETVKSSLQQAAGKHPLIRELAEQNVTLLKEVQADTNLLNTLASDTDLTHKETERINKEFSSARQKLNIAGLSQVLGTLLLEQRRSLPEPATVKWQLAEIEEKIVTIGLNQIQHDDERKKLRHISEYIQRRTIGLTAKESLSIENDLTLLATQRRTLLEKTVGFDKIHLQSLNELDISLRELLDTATAFDNFLAENLLWIRSIAPPSTASLYTIPEHLAYFTSPGRWIDFFRAVGSRSTQSPFLFLTLIAMGFIYRKTRNFSQALMDNRKKIHKPSTDRFRYTLQEAGLIILKATPWPLLLAVVGWELSRSNNPTDLVKSISSATLRLAPIVFYFNAFRALCEKDGLAEEHFRWPSESLEILRHQLDLFIPIFLPSAFVTLVVLSSNSAPMGGELGRIMFCLVVLMLAVFFYRLLHHRHGPLRGFYHNKPNSPISKIAFAFPSLAIAMPIFLLGLALYGYVYTSATLLENLMQTFWFIFGLVVAQQLAVRWLLVMRRRVAFQAAVERRRIAREAAESKETDSTDVDAGATEIEEPKIDIVTLSEDSRKLLDSVLLFTALGGLWLIWTDVLPALGILDEVSLWQQSEIVDGEEKRIPVTLGNVTIAIVIGIITYVASKRLPALLEIVLLQRLKGSSGGLYAATTLSGYAIAAIGALLALKAIGGSWSQIQWLAAALSVGIGFGLQEIVANFISGLIILFERPIRVGDVVTIGDTDGVVTRIRIRATTIRNWDRKELIVPNKEFITGRLLNWSLTDQTTRLIIPVGIAYGSDVQRAMYLIAQAAEENKQVLDDPAPFITFDGFGDNALSLNLRFYVGSIEHRLGTRTALHEAINNKLNDAGIGISFPQRDIHLDTNQPLEVRLTTDSLE
ncbi:MAG: mechanosensitive ion channel domain-containing protein [Methylococcales bacterium]